MTARESVAFSVGRDAAHCEVRQLMTAGEREGYGSQRAASEALGARLRRARVERWLLEVFGNGKGQ